MSFSEIRRNESYGLFIVFERVELTNGKAFNAAVTITEEIIL